MIARRATTTPTFLDLVDTLSRGGTDEWRALYQQAAVDPALRAEIAVALRLVDPEIGAARELWTYLLTTLPPAVLSVPRS